MDASMPCCSRLQLDLEAENALFPLGLRVGARNEDVDPTVKRGHAALALVGIFMTGGIAV